MRRQHTGNRMEIVAKKPSGWIGHRHPIPTASPLTTASSTASPPQYTTATASAITFPVVTEAETTTVAVETTVKDKTTFEDTTVRNIRPPTLPPTLRQPTTSPPTTPFIPTTEYHTMESDWTLPVNGKQPAKEVHKGIVLFVSDPGAPSPATPWYLRWMMYKDEEKLVVPIVGGAVVSLFVIILAVVWMKRRRSRRNRTVMEKMNADVHPADKENLLTEPSGVSDEEQ